MTLKDYLHGRSEKDEEFALRAGVSRATIKRIHATGCARSTAVVQKIVAASNGDVTVADLVVTAPAKRRRSKKDAA